MRYNRKAEIPDSVLLGCLAAFAAEAIWTILSCFVSAVIIEKGVIDSDNVSLLAAGILLAGSMLATFAAIHYAKERPWLMAAATAILYFTQLLIVNMLIFRIGMNGVLVTALLISGGTIAAALLNRCKNESNASYKGKAKLGKLYKFNR